MSWQMRALMGAITLVRKVRPASEERAERRIAAPKTPSTPPVKLTKEFDVSTKTIDGFDVHVVSPNGSDHTMTVIYVHGGAYVHEIDNRHWALIAELASELGVDVWAPIYGLAPQYHAEQAIALMDKVLRDASSTGPVYLIGDSAGGGLALAATLLWNQAGNPSPLGLTLMAPWLEIFLRNPDIAAMQDRDPFGSITVLRMCGRSWIADMSPDDPRVSPINGDLSVVPPIDLYVGDRDLTLPDCRRLRDTVPPGRMIYHEEPGAIHVYPLFPVPEGRAARKAMVAHVKNALAKV
jgi:acetyl esterase/lipase